MRNPVSLLLVLLLGACSGDPGTGPVEVSWDRVGCERCRMVLSDRQHSAQVRFKQASGKSQVLFFDDIGCAVIWLQDKPFAAAPDTEIWVTDWRSGEWIDARAATYLAGQHTPMEYGLGAQIEPSPDGLNFEQARQHVFEVERRFNLHAQHFRESQSAGSPKVKPESGQ
jgi:copper chaperone NosL